MNKLYLFFTTLLSTLFVSQTILNKSENVSRTVSDPNSVILAQGFTANWQTSNPFIAKIGPSSDLPSNPTNSDAGSSNPSGSVGDIVFHDTKGNIEVNGGGQLQYNLPIALPPGIRSVAPQINLTYSSGSGNGIAGYGWSISGITAISRVGKNIDRDGEVKGIQLNYSDYYSFNGQRLILISGEYGKDGAEYVTEKFSNIKIKSKGSLSGLEWQGPEYWEVTFEDGSQAWYGGIASGYSEARTPIDYNIVKWKDSQDNYISYGYIKEASKNVAFISSIQWGGNENVQTSHFNEIKFNYNIARNFKEISFLNGIKLFQDKLLSEIIVSTDVSNSPTIFRKYEVEYEGTNYQYVKKITEKNKDSINNSANPVNFQYTTNATSTIQQNQFFDFNTVKLSGDFDGNGLIDNIVYRNSEALKCTSPSVPYITYFNLGVTSTAYSNCSSAPTGTVPAGYYVYLETPKSFSKNYYLGSENIFENAVPISVLDSQNYLSGEKGFVTYKIDPTTKNMTLYYYLIDNTKSIENINDLRTPTNALLLIRTRVITKNQYDESYTNNGPNPYESQSQTTSLGKLFEYDIEGDGIPEVLIEKKNTYTARYCDNTANLNGNLLPPPGDCNTSTSDSYKYIVVKQDNTTDFYQAHSPGGKFLEGAVQGDFNGDGIIDFGRVNGTSTNTNYTYNTEECYTHPHTQQEICHTVTHTVTVPRFELTTYNIKKSASTNNYEFVENFNARFDGHKDFIQVGDFNGDGKSDLFARANQSGANYIISLNKGNSFESKEYLDKFYDTYTNTGSTSRSYSVAKVVDINNDGKSDILNFYSSVVVNQTIGGGNSSFKIRVDENIGYSEDRIQFLPNAEKPYNSNVAYVFQEILGNFINNSYNNAFSIYGYSQSSNFLSGFWKYEHYVDHQNKKINLIEQGKVTTGIEYRGLHSIYGNYDIVKKEQYPYLELNKISQFKVVYQISQNIPIYNFQNNNFENTIRKQDFRFRGYITHLKGKGTVGFRQTARSSWYTDALINTKVWNGAEIDPLNDGIIIKEWSRKTNAEVEVFPQNISESNTQLLTFKSIDFRIDKLIDGSIVDINNITVQDRSKLVSATVAVKTISKDFQKNVRTESDIDYDWAHYLPLTTQTTINQVATRTSQLLYSHNTSGEGKNYFVGRPLSTSEITTLSSPLNSIQTKEEFTYDDKNLVKTKKLWNRDNTGGFIESYEYDDWGNIIRKEIKQFSAPATTREISKVDRAFYDTKGRFVIKKIDNLNLETLIEYNDWGLVTKETDPSGIVLTNDYDSWGKLIKSKTNLGGTTSYTYEKSNLGDAIVKSFSPDGDTKETFTDKLGQTYKTTTKNFGLNQYTSTITSFDGLGRKSAVSEPFSGQYPTKWNTIVYDDFSRPITATSYTGKIVETTYNDTQRSITITEKNTKNFTYDRFRKQTSDELGNIISTEDLGGIVSFKYNAAGENIEANYGGNIIKTQYDSYGNKSRFEDPSNGIYEYEYKGYFGAISKAKSPKGEKKYTYNNLGQLRTQTENTAGISKDKIINFEYNAKGLITKKHGTSSGRPYINTFTYDSFGRTLSCSEESNGKLFIRKGITYDDRMRIVSYEKSLYSSGILTEVKIENIYDSWSGELYQVKQKDTGKILWELQQVDERGKVKNAKLGAINITNSYDTNGFLNNINHSSSINNGTVLQIGYNFDAIKNELKSRTTGGDFNIIESFQYDDNNRLYNWTDPSTNSFSNNQPRNMYDSKGRITYNDQVGSVKFDNSQKIYQPTSLTLNSLGSTNYNNDLIQSITYNENNDPIFIDGIRGDVGFEYGLTSMRQKVTYGGNFDYDKEGKFTKYYSEDGSYEIIRNNKTGQEKHQIYIGGTPYESNIVYLKDFASEISKFVFLHKDYLGSILAITDDEGIKLEQRHFDAWGNITHLKIANNTTITNKDQIRDYLSNGNLIIDRGYTGHEHFAEVGLIHMNGRLYDPLLRRFLNADENIQDPHNTQNYNKYGYVMNNPMMYADPSGEFIWFVAAIGLFWGSVATGAIIGAGIAVLTYSLGAALSGSKWSVGGALKSMFWGAVGGAVTAGIGSCFSVVQNGAYVASKFAETTLGALVQGGAHAVAQGTLALMQGGTFQQAFLSAALGSLAASGFSKVAGGWSGKAGGQIFFGAIAGGVGAELTGGNFWQGAIIGGVVAGLNHAMHDMDSDLEDDPRKPIKSKRVRTTDGANSLKGSRGGQSIITQENPGNQVGNGKGIFVPSGSQSMVTADMTYYNDGTVDINMTTQAARMNTTGSYIANYDIVGPSGKIISSGILLDKGLGINARMDYSVFTQRGSAAVLSTATFRNIPMNSTIRVNIGLTYKIPMGSIGAMQTHHKINVR
ncbi:RHS repeat-associated core domain-containing protein [Epilithonimonas vandammei]|uniref:Type IV secretion protein Rhs n=1 Tax=Epilithonimonas vandammei TaxID=2487072 RepID=A0A3G8Y147_9FLAO|nr:RHS repeat-associated core domain-containing protein [Epilithonimonas vandammei]AZI39192.1 type IV secretion protein Rhs [Epilithonimonas vandammei]